MTDDMVLNTREAAEYLGAHVETVRRLARRGEIPSFKLGADWRFSREALRRWFEAQGTNGAPPMVLVVDDDPDILRMMARMVTRIGCRVQTAADGAAALDMVAQGAPDLVFLDLDMPRMNGADFLERLRPSHQGLPVVIVTGYPDGELMHRAAQNAPVLLINKPANPVQVEFTIRALVGDRLRAE